MKKIIITLMIAAFLYFRTSIGLYINAYEAAEHGSEFGLRVFLFFGADPNYRKVIYPGYHGSKYYVPILKEAALANKTKNVEVLLDSGAKIDWSSFTAALLWSDIEIIILLLNRVPKGERQEFLNSAVMMCIEMIERGDDRSPKFKGLFKLLVTKYASEQELKDIIKSELSDYVDYTRFPEHRPPQWTYNHLILKPWVVEAFNDRGVSLDIFNLVEVP